MKKRLLILIGVLFSFSALAGGKVHVEGNSVYLSDFQTQELEKMFEELAYDKYIDLPDEEYPRIFVKNIPSDFATQENATERNRTFMKILIPIVLKINEEISEEREMVDALLYDFEQHKDFNRMDMEYIDKLAQKYDVTTHFKDTRKYIKLLNELRKKVDIVPASLLVAGAAIYTNWGTSRIVLKANNLFKTK
ncbi:MAG: glucosaminidase domain-containing protein, partial [Alphaproteobacteria bacterium]|nr:glucosaminidase domain-containing protein [Alphaproteobacteria bacterium]